MFFSSELTVKTSAVAIFLRQRSWVTQTHLCVFFEHFGTGSPPGQVLLLDRSRAPSRDPSPHDLWHRRTSAEACAASWHALWKRGKELEQHANAESLFDLPAKLVEQVLTVRLMDMPHFWKSSTADVQQDRNPFQIHPLWSCMIWIDNNKLWSFCF